MSSPGIIKTIKDLTKKSGERGQRLKKIKALNAAIGELHAEIIEALKKLPNPKDYETELNDINVALTELADELTRTDAENDDVIKIILENANKLIEIRESIPGSDRNSSSVTKLRQQMGALESLPPPPSSPPPPYQRSYLDAARPNGPIRPDDNPFAGRPDDNPFSGRSDDNSLRGGYKHSKTNSRKYMVKKFKSARNSIKRKKRRRSRTLRRSSYRK